MTDTPATPASTSVVTTVGKDITWIRTHILMALLAVALIAGSIIGGISLFESLIEKHDARVAAAQQAKEGVDTATQAALVQQMTQDRAAADARDAAKMALIQTLVTQMAQQHAQTAKQVVTDAALDAQAAAARLAAQTKASPSDVTVSNDSVTMTLPLTRTVVADLDLLPQAQADVVNLQGQLDAQKILTSDSQVGLTDANKIIAQDKLDLVATIKADNAACVVQTNTAVDKQKTKDGKYRWFYAILGGVVGGFIGHGI